MLKRLLHRPGRTAVPTTAEPLDLWTLESGAPAPATPAAAPAPRPPLAPTLPVAPPPAAAPTPAAPAAPAAAPAAPTAICPRCAQPRGEESTSAARFPVCGACHVALDAEVAAERERRYLHNWLHSRQEEHDALTVRLRQKARTLGLEVAAKPLPATSDKALMLARLASYRAVGAGVVADEDEDDEDDDEEVAE